MFVEVEKYYFLFRLFAIPANFIQEIMTETKLIRYWKVKDQIDTIEKLEIKLKYSVKNKY